MEVSQNDFKVAEYLDRLARHGVGLRLTPAGLRVSGPSDDIIAQARPIIARHKAAIVDWLKENPAPTPRQPIHRDNAPTHCCVCSRPVFAFAGTWGDMHPFCVRHMPKAGLPITFLRTVFPGLADDEFETVERLAIIHELDEKECAALKPSRFTTIVDATQSTTTAESAEQSSPTAAEPETTRRYVV